MCSPVCVGSSPTRRVQRLSPPYCPEDPCLYVPHLNGSKRPEESQVQKDWDWGRLGSEEPLWVSRSSIVSRQLSQPTTLETKPVSCQDMSDSKPTKPGQPGCQKTRSPQPHQITFRSFPIASHLLQAPTTPSLTTVSYVVGSHVRRKGLVPVFFAPPRFH